MLETKRLKPYLLSLVIFVCDQLTKLWIVKNIPAYDWDSFITVLGKDFFRIIHVRNLGAAFSLGSGLPEGVRFLLLKLLTLAVLLWVARMVYHREKEGLTSLQSWLLAGVIGGGVGNLADRFFRPQGVVDFLDFKFYGLFGLERWPTFNIADASTVVCVSLLIITLLIQSIEQAKKGSEHEQNS